MMGERESGCTTLRPAWVWTPGGARSGVCVEIRDGTIVGLTPSERHPTVDVELPGRLLIPAMVNAHSHAFQRAFRGHVQHRPAGRDDFWSWRDRMYAVANGLDPDGVEAVSRLAFLEMAEAGIGQVGEFHYLHHAPDGARYADPDELARRVVRAALDVGIRITLLRVAYARNGAGAPLRDDQRRFGDRSPDEVLAAVARLRALEDPRVRVGLAPHSVRAVPLDWLGAFAGFDGPVHVHVAEQPAEVVACQAEYGRSPVGVLEQAGLLHDRLVAVHLTHPDPGDVGRLRDVGAGVCACPGTELDLGDGFLPLAARDLSISVGSDSQATIDLFAEARAVELHARALAGRRNVMAPEGSRHGLAERILAIATTTGDRHLGGPGLGIEPGAPADLVAIDLRRPAAEGVPPLEAAAFVATPEWVSDLWVAGRRIVRDGRHPDRDEVVRAARPFLLSSTDRG